MVEVVLTVLSAVPSRALVELELVVVVPYTYGVLVVLVVLVLAVLKAVPSRAFVELELELELELVVVPYK